VGQVKTWTAGNGNLLLANLPLADRELVLRHCEDVSMEQARTLYDPNAAIEHVYFPTQGMVSMLGAFSDGTAVETLVIGREGMVGVPVFHGADHMPEQAVVQLALTAHRMSSDAFRKAVAQSPRLRQAIHAYSACAYMFVAQSVACASRHDTTRRLARWMLHAADHSDTNHMELTHLFIAHMLGVRRSSVTVAANKLRAKGLLTYTRKRIDIVDRDGLKDASCECYAIVKSTYDRLLFGVRSENPLAELESSHRGLSTLGSAAPDRGANRGGNGR
jgi:CRP-like cAMP-binding protein